MSTTPCSMMLQRSGRLIFRIFSSRLPITALVFNQLHYIEFTFRYPVLYFRVFIRLRMTVADFEAKGPTIMNKILSLTAGLCLLAACTTPTTQPVNSSAVTPGAALSLERIYQKHEFKTESAPQLRWLKQQQAYTILEKPASTTPAKDTDKKAASTEASGFDIVRYQAKDGSRDILVKASELIPAGAKAPLEIEDYQWSDDQQKLLIFTQSVKVWRDNTRGDYWVFDLKSRTLQAIGGKDFEAKQLMFAKFSPDSQQLAYVYKNNLYVQQVGTTAVRQLTFDGSATLVNGATDWVYEEEFMLADGFRWSPDSQHLAYWQFDTSNAKIFTMINNTDTLYPTLQQFPYPKVGEKNAWVNVAVVNVQTAKNTWIDLGPKQRDDYVPQLAWTPAGDQLLIQQVDRPQQKNNLLIADIKSGKTRSLMLETDSAFLDQIYEVEWLDNTQNFLWISERDGWRHLYLASLDGKPLLDLTPDAYDLTSVVHVDKTSGWVYFLAAQVNQGETELYRTSWRQPGQVERVTPAEQRGIHSYQISADGQWAIHRFSNQTTPPQTSLIALPSHQVQKAMVKNEKLIAKLSTLQLSPVEFFQVQASDGLPLDGWLIKPAQFDANKKYPIIFYVYGEAWGQTVNNSWQGSMGLWHQLLAQQGFIVASIDNRGARAPKGRDWRKSIYKLAGVASSKDQSDALLAMQQRYPFIDAGRVGIYGHSGGGSSTLNMLFRYPQQYHVGIASAPVADIRLYDTIYQERYSGLLPGNEKAYENSAPITHAKNLQGKLLLIHGTGDDNVHYQGTERLINELVKHNKAFEMLSYPNRSHGLYEGAGTTLHIQSSMLRYFKTHLQPTK